MDKDSPRTTAGELQKIVESRGQKTLKKKSNSTYITTCLSGFCCVCHVFPPLVSIFGLFPVLI